MNKDGKACIRTKHWSTDETWSTFEGAHEGVFLRTMPPGAPTLVRPSKLDKQEWDRVKSSYKASASPRMNTKQYKWWNSFMAQLDEQINGNYLPKSFIKFIIKEKNVELVGSDLTKY